MYASTNRYNISKNTNMISFFGGINDTYGCAEGEWREANGLTSRYYPSLASERADADCSEMFIDEIKRPLGMFVSSDGSTFAATMSGIYIKHTDRLNSTVYCKIPFSQIPQDMPDASYEGLLKQSFFIEMGSKVLFYATPVDRYFAQGVIQKPIYIWIDKVKLCQREGIKDTVDDISAAKDNIWGEFHKEKTYECSFALCTISGDGYEDVSDTYPASPSDGQYVYDSEKGALYVYSAMLKDYTAVDTVYCKISAEGIDTLFDRYDTVKIYAVNKDDEAASKILDAVCGYKTIHQKGDGYIIITADIKSISASGISLKISQEVPRFDFIFGHKNRVFGCRYGTQPTTDARSLKYSEPFVNEIYASALGSFNNWYSFEGISTDSYTASIGTGAEFTAATAYNSAPTFFKENKIYFVSGNHPAEYTISEITSEGVAKSGGNTLATLNGVLYYLSPFGVCAYAGGVPHRISEALGYEQNFVGFSGFAFEDKYYISLKKDEKTFIYSYDTVRAIWHREEYLSKALSICGIERDNIYALFKDGSIKRLAPRASIQEEQAYKDFFAESTDLGYSLPDKKYVSLIRIRLSLEPDADVSLYIDYDSEGKFEKKASVHDHNSGTYMIEIVPQRCDHYRLRIQGHGGIKIFSITYDIENGGVR